MRPNLRDRIFDYTRLAFWIGLIATMYVLAALINLSAKNTQLREKADRTEEQVITLQNDIDDLKAQIDYYKTDAYKERFAREKLGLQAPGESVVIVGRGDAERQVDKSQSQQPTIALEPKSHLEEWGEFLFGAQP